MRYLVKARLLPGKAKDLLWAIEHGDLGQGSVAGGEYLRVMGNARHLDNGEIRWIEICYCEEPLKEERPYWEKYFELVSVTNAHSRVNCRDLAGLDKWACEYCDCTQKVELQMATQGEPFLAYLRHALAEAGWGAMDTH